MTYTYILLHLSLIPDIGPATVQHLIATLGNLEQLSTLYEYSSAQLCAQFGITPKRAQAIATGLADLSLLERELLLIEKHAVSWTTALCLDYPPLLRTIHVPPTIIYWQGRNPSNYNKPVAIVGSRDANQYGHAVIESFVPSLVQAGCTIVSGGALGIDTMAHRATVTSAGVTCVVLGSGLLHPYPFENGKLFKDVLEHDGTMLSVFSLNTRPLAGNFPARNRVISGLSKGCIVVQAAQKSGARITAECALEQGRSVCAVPGPIDDPLSAGCHDLIKNGALLVTSAQDVLQELEYYEQDDINKNTQITYKKNSTHANDNPTRSTKPDARNKPIDSNMMDVDAKTLNQTTSQQRHSRNSTKLANKDESQLKRSLENTATQTPVSLSPAQQILQLCIQPISVDTLMEVTQLSFAELNELLFDLQISGKITQTFAGLWCKRK